MHRIINASFPRSGHHMMLGVLQNYFGDEMKCCKWSDDFEKRPHLCPETNFTMVHDMHLTFPGNDPYWKYLVLVRHPIYSLASWRIHKKLDDGNICEDLGVTQQKLEFWAKWMNKWVLSPVNNRLIVQYESLVSNPFSVFEKIIRFCSDSPVDAMKLKRYITEIAPVPNTTDNWIGWL